jgi:hypothetical protein
MRTTVNATGTSSVIHQPELLSLVLTTLVLTINRKSPHSLSLENAVYGPSV